MSDRIIREIEKLIEAENREENSKKIEMSSSLKDAARELEEKLNQAKYECDKLKDYLPSEIKERILRFVKGITDVTRY